MERGRQARKREKGGGRTTEEIRVGKVKGHERKKRVTSDSKLKTTGRSGIELKTEEEEKQPSPSQQAADLSLPSADGVAVFLSSKSALKGMSDFAPVQSFHPYNVDVSARE